MNLYYIHLGLNYYDYIEQENELRYEFQRHTNFIDDYFSKAIRKAKCKTDGTFNMISISPTEYGVKKPSIVPSSALKVILPFDKSQYEKIRGTADCSYYLELLDNGFKEAAQFKAVPLDTLLNIIEEFKQGGCKNEWIHKKKRFKEEDLEVTLACEFTTNYFQLVAIIDQISTKKQLVKGIVMKTEAGTSIHEGMYKDIIVDKEIVITDSSDSPRIIIKKADVFEGKLNYKLIGDKEIKEMLSFDL